MTTPMKMIKLPARLYKRAVNETTKVKTLMKVSVLATEDGNEEYADIAKKRINRLVREATKQEDLREFRDRISAEGRYTTLNRYRRRYFEGNDAERLRIINRRMNDLLKEGVLKTKRRKEGTGERVERTLKYSDTASNKKLDRVGKEYTRVVWEGAEYEEIDRKIRKRRMKKRVLEDGEEPPPKRRNLWIEAVQQAKTDLKAPAFLIVRREANNPKDKVQKLGVKVYKRAVQIMAKLKARSEEEKKMALEQVQEQEQVPSEAAPPVEAN